MSKLLHLFKSKQLYLGICRYALGVSMIPYGLSKILRMQFILYPSRIWQEPLEKLSGIHLTWSFLGYSPWYQTLLGILEFVPAVLLLFRRTTLIGSILMFPMTLNVFLINEAYNLWPGTKTISLILLCLNVAIFLFEWTHLKSVLQTILYKGRQLRFKSGELLINIIILTTVVAYYGTMLGKYWNKTDQLAGDWYNHRPHEWVLKSELIGDSSLQAQKFKLYFSSPNHLFEKVTDENHEIYRGHYTLDPNRQFLSMKYDNETSDRDFSYIIKSDTLLELKERDNEPHTEPRKLIFRLRVINKPNK